MSLLDLLDDRARRLAQAHGHQVTDLVPARHDTYIGHCVRCGAPLIVRARPASCGIRGAACSSECQSTPSSPARADLHRV